MRIDPNKHPAYIIGFAAIASGLFTAGIMALHVATEPIVKANQRLLTEKAIVELFNLGQAETMTPEQIAELIRRRVAGLEDPDRSDPAARPITISDPGTGRSMRLLVAYKSDMPAGAEVDIHDKQNVLGYAFPIRGVGFWAMIDGWLAVQPDGQKALGVVFLSHQETPGLGGRITEEVFRKQFAGLDVSQPKQGMEYVQIDRDKPQPGSPEAARHVDAITGATGTSTAVGTFINKGFVEFRQIAQAAGLLEAGEASKPQTQGAETQETQPHTQP